jgi:hypothetical protein
MRIDFKTQSRADRHLAICREVLEGIVDGPEGYCFAEAIAVLKEAGIQVAGEGNPRTLAFIAGRVILA